MIWSTTGIPRTKSQTLDIYHGGNSESMETESRELTSEDLMNTRSEGQAIWSTPGIPRAKSATLDIYHGGNSELMDTESE